MGITHSGAHTKGCLGWLCVGGGGSDSGLTHLGASLAASLRALPSVFVERVPEPVPAVLLLITVPHYRNHFLKKIFS